MQTVIWAFDFARVESLFIASVAKRLLLFTSHSDVNFSRDKKEKGVVPRFKSTVGASPLPATPSLVPAAFVLPSLRDVNFSRDKKHDMAVRAAATCHSGRPLRCLWDDHAAFRYSNFP